MIGKELGRRGKKSDEDEKNGVEGITEEGRQTEQNKRLQRMREGMQADTKAEEKGNEVNCKIRERGKGKERLKRKK